jgi:hypothetical protein
MGACGSTNNQKPTTSNVKPQQIQTIQPTQNLIEKQPPARMSLSDSEKPKKKIKIRFISEEENDLKNFVFEKEYHDFTIFSQVVKDLQNNGDVLDQDADYAYTLLRFNILSDDKKFAEREKVDLTDGGKINQSLKYILDNKLINDSVATFEFSYTGLKISKDSRRAYMNLNNFISSPKYDNEPFGLNIYDNASSILHYYAIPEEISENTEVNLKVFNNFSAYCNGRNRLFISGGTKDDDVFLGDFVEIDLEKLSQEGVASKGYIRKLPNLNVARGWHSMLFVPDKYIFIVGGSNTNSVELYDLETNKLTYDSDLNERKSESSLCLVNNNYLYAFFGFQFLNNFTNTIEKCNLKKSVRTWEKIVLSNVDVSMVSNFYTIAYGKIFQDHNEIILVGANENYSNKQSEFSKQKKNYVFRQIGRDEHLLEEFNIQEIDQPCVCSEKFFLPVNETSSFLLPTYIAENLSLLKFNPELTRLDEIKFEPLNDQEQVYVVERSENRLKIVNSLPDPINHLENPDEAKEEK